MDRVSTRAAKRTPADRSSESEFRLLTAAATVLVEEGYAALTFDRVGEVSGFSRGLASQKFGSKDGMVLAVVAFLNNRLDQRYREGMVEAANPLDEIMAYLSIFLEEIETDHLSLSYFVLLAATVANKSNVQSAFVDAHQKVKRSLADIISRGQAAGVIRRDIAPDTAALSIGAFQLGVATQLRLDPAFDSKAVRALSLRTIRTALATEGQAAASNASPP